MKCSGACGIRISSLPLYIEPVYRGSEKKFYSACLSVILTAVLYVCLAEADAAQGWGFYVDNDEFSPPGGTDRDYTGSFAIAYATAENNSLPFSLDKATALFGPDKSEPGTLHTHGFEFGVVAFTPENLTTSEPQHTDRPYASLIYVTGKRQRVDVRDNSSFTLSLTVGALGLAAASGIQREVHQLVGSNQPGGWNNQISDDGELTFRYLWEYRQLQGDYVSEDGRRLQWATATGFSFGYLTETLLGLSMRYGHLTDPWWSFHSSPTGFGDRMLTAPGQFGSGAGFYLWASMSASLRLYNVFLEGQFRDSIVTYDNDQLRPVTGHFSIGAGWTFDNRWRFSYSIQRQTSEVETGLADRTITWGGFVLEIPVD